MIYAVMERDGISFKVKTLNDEQTCGLDFSTKKISSWWLAKKYLNQWRANPTWPLSRFKQQVVDNIQVDVTKWHYSRGRNYAMQVIAGSIKEQYANLWDYCEALLTSNPGSTVKMKCNEIACYYARAWSSTTSDIADELVVLAERKLTVLRLCCRCDVMDPNRINEDRDAATSFYGLQPICLAADARLWWMTLGERAMPRHTWTDFQALLITCFGPVPDKGTGMPYRYPEIYWNMHHTRYFSYVADWHAYPHEFMGHYCRRFREMMSPHIPQDLDCLEMQALHVLREGLPPRLDDSFQHLWLE
ncbi:hypothetical protein TIFTF001_015314 [Ficus carica]|uniref:Uncharacterized protein n=1 Tax=Ficus carica TaxID=3494 RepID=A0AA88D506_FICCA|nr:hypothetical protein TIFTF001_015314 [Ficus carica]